MGRKIGRMFRTTHNIIIPESGSTSGRHSKLLVDIDLFKALPRGTKLKEGDKCVWISFSYDQLPIFCIYCGYLGRDDKSCNQRQHDIRSNQVKEGQFGDWMRAAVFKDRKKKGCEQEVISNAVAPECKQSTTKVDQPRQNPHSPESYIPLSTPLSILTHPSQQPKEPITVNLDRNNKLTLLTLPTTSHHETQTMNLEQHVVSPKHPQTSSLINIPILTESQLLPYKEG